MPSWHNNVRTVVFFIIAGLTFSSCGAKRQAVNAMAPDFELQDTSGKTVHLSQFRGHPVLLDFWATWCGPCVISIPSTEKLYETYKDKGLVVLGLNMDDDVSEVNAFVNHMNMTYPVLLAGKSQVPGLYGLEGLPLFIVIDPQGRITQRYDGFSPVVPDAIDHEMTQMLAAPKA